MRLNCARTEVGRFEKEKDGSLFGLISEIDSGSTELHGFEIDINGRVLIPELCPNQDHNSNEAEGCLTR